MGLDSRSVRLQRDFYKTKRLQYRLKFASCLLLFAILWLILYLCGIFSIIREQSFSEFTYPLEVPNFKALISELDKLRLEQNITVLNCTVIDDLLKQVEIDGIQTSRLKSYKQFDQFQADDNIIFDKITKPLIVLDVKREINYLDNKQHFSNIKVTIIVKSAVNYHTKRDSIRKSWKLIKQIDLFKFKTLFIVGNCHSSNPVPKVLSKSLNGLEWNAKMCNDFIKREALTYGDIIQSTGIDTYHNNTIKTIMTHKWANEQQESDFVVAIDDDYALEVENLIDFLQNEALKVYNSQDFAFISTNNMTVISRDNLSERKKLLFALKELSQRYFYAGYLHYLHRPLRFPTNKFYMSTQEYPFDRYPPFITGGLIVMSQKFSRHLYLSSFLVKSYKFDDVYLGIIAYKLNVEAVHSDNFMCDQSAYKASEPYKLNSTKCIGVHDIAPEDLVDIWTQKRQEQQQQRTLSHKKTFATAAA